jgi:hypothetical protein
LLERVFTQGLQHSRASNNGFHIASGCQRARDRALSIRILSPVGVCFLTVCVPFFSNVCYPEHGVKQDSIVTVWVVLSASGKSADGRSNSCSAFLVEVVSTFLNCPAIPSASPSTLQVDLHRHQFPPKHHQNSAHNTLYRGRRFPMHDKPLEQYGTVLLHARICSKGSLIRGTMARQEHQLVWSSCSRLGLYNVGYIFGENGRG